MSEYVVVRSYRDQYSEVVREWLVKVSDVSAVEENRYADGHGQVGYTMKISGDCWRLIDQESYERLKKAMEGTLNEKHSDH